MKIITISFPDSTDVSSLVLGLTPVSVGAPGALVAGGEVMMVGQLPDAPPEGAAIDHIHATSTPNSETSPPL